MSDLGSQPREVWKQPDRRPAEGRLDSSENTSKPRRCLFLLLRSWPSLHMCYLFGIRRSATSFDLMTNPYSDHLHLHLNVQKNTIFAVFNSLEFFCASRIIRKLKYDAGR
jgi:hypothetical protein